MRLFFTRLVTGMRIFSLDEFASDEKKTPTIEAAMVRNMADIINAKYLPTKLPLAR